MTLQASKPQLRRWIDTVGEVYAKFVIAATCAALIVLPMCGVPMLRYVGPCWATGVESEERKLCFLGMNVTDVDEPPSQLLHSANGQRGAFYRAMGLLTTASPCALVLVPLAYVSAIAAITSRCRCPDAQYFANSCSLERLHLGQCVAVQRPWVSDHLC
jgi:Zn2+/Cd2+-exporting ATPase